MTEMITVRHPSFESWGVVPLRSKTGTMRGSSSLAISALGEQLTSLLEMNHEASQRGQTLWSLPTPVNYDKSQLLQDFVSQTSAIPIEDHSILTEVLLGKPAQSCTFTESDGGVESRVYAYDSLKAGSSGDRSVVLIDLAGLSRQVARVQWRFTDVRVRDPATGKSDLDKKKIT